MLLKEIESANYITKDDGYLFYDLYKTWNYSEKQSKILGKINSFEVRFINFNFCGTQIKIYALFHIINEEYVMFVETRSFKGNTRSIMIERTAIHKDYQGMNLSVKLYSWMILNQNLILVSGNAQSPGGRSIWERLAKIRGIFMFGYNFVDKLAFQIDQNDLFNEDLYDSDLNDELTELYKEREKLYKEDKLLLNKQKTMTINYKEIIQKIAALNKKISIVKSAKDETLDIRLIAMKGKAKLTK